MLYILLSKYLPLSQTFLNIFKVREIHNFLHCLPDVTCHLKVFAHHIHFETRILRNIAPTYCTFPLIASQLAQYNTQATSQCQLLIIWQYYNSHDPTVVSRNHNVSIVLRVIYQRFIQWTVWTDYITLHDTKCTDSMFKGLAHCFFFFLAISVWDV